MPKWIKVVKWLFLLLVLFFLFRYFYIHLEDLRNTSFDFRPGWFLAAMAFFAVYKINLSLLWHLITKKNGAAIALDKAIVSWFYSLLGKYIPGKVFLLGGRLYFYHRDGISKKKVTFCFFIENICTLLGAAFLFLVSTLFIRNGVLEHYRYASIALIGAFFVVIHPGIMNGIINMVLALLKKKPVQITMSYKDMLQLVGLFIANWMIVGTGFFILVNSIHEISIEYLFYVAGTFGLSIIIGILSLFAPSGIGVREGIIILGLSYIMPESVAIAVSIVSRLWVTVAELLMVAIVYVIAKAKGIKVEPPAVVNQSETEEN